jgi:hypothetical protein
MSMASSDHAQDHLDSLCLHALEALPESDAAEVEAQIADCAECRQDLEALRRIVGAFVSWPADVLRPSASLWERLARRVAAESGQEPLLTLPQQPEPEWEDVAPGISCKLLATDTERGRVSMLVRLEPGTEYPPHTHADVEELHLLQGVLMVDDKRLHPGDYLRSESGTADRRVWSETGCTCVLLTSARDVLR